MLQQRVPPGRKRDPGMGITVPISVTAQFRVVAVDQLKGKCAVR